MRSQETQLSLLSTYVGAAILLAVVLFFLFFQSAKIVVEVLPKNAIVTVNNAPMKVIDGKAEGKFSLGKHILKVEADDYIGARQEIKLTRGNNYSKNISLTLAPVPTLLADSAANIALQDNQIFYQNQSDKLIYRLIVDNTNGAQPRVLSNTAISSKPITADQMIWSPSKESLLLKRGNTASIFDFKRYDFVNQSETLLSENVGDVAWAPDNSKIAYVYQPAGGERTLILSDNSNRSIFRAVDLKSLDIENPYIAFSPDSAWVVIIPRNDNFDENKIYLLNIYTKETRLVNDTGNQKEAVFTADSKKIIYSSFSADPNNGAASDLSIMDLDGKNRRGLGIQAKATDIRLWDNPNEVFLLAAGSGSKLILKDLNSANTLNFFFKGQQKTLVSQIILNNSKNGAIFLSEGKLWFTQLLSN